MEPAVDHAVRLPEVLFARDDGKSDQLVESGPALSPRRPSARPPDARRTDHRSARGGWTPPRRVSRRVCAGDPCDDRAVGEVLSALLPALAAATRRRRGVGNPLGGPLLRRAPLSAG